MEGGDRMIEIVVREYLAKNLSVPVYMEEPEEIPETNNGDNTDNNTPSVQPTQNSCSTKIKTPTYTENDSFMMYIDKVYTVSGRGTFISGTILRGTVELNDPLEIVGLNKETQTTVVTGLEVAGAARDSIKMGEEAAILLRGLATSDIEVGQVIAKPQSVTAKSEVEVELCVLTKEDGGRHTPFFSNYRPVVQFGTTTIPSTVTLPAGVEMVMPGDNLTVTLKLDTPVVLETGSVLTLTEGGRVIGLGKVKIVIN
jgi:elongation factor Tu